MKNENPKKSRKFCSPKILGCPKKIFFDEKSFFWAYLEIDKHNNGSKRNLLIIRQNVQNPF